MLMCFMDKSEQHDKLWNNVMSHGSTEKDFKSAKRLELQTE